MPDKPHRANGADLIEFYASQEPDPEFADALEEAHRQRDRPIGLSFRYGDEATPPARSD